MSTHLKPPSSAEGTIGPSHWPGVCLQHFDLDASLLAELTQVLQEAAAELQVQFRLSPHTGDVVLVDEQTAASIPSLVLHALCDERPAIHFLCTSNPASPPQVEREMLRQALRQQIPPLVNRAKRNPAETAFASAWPGASQDSGFDADSRFDTQIAGQSPTSIDFDQQRVRLLETVLAGGLDPWQHSLSAGYGEGRAMVFDFLKSQVRMDRAAWDHLRSSHELPSPNPALKPQPEAIERPLDQVLWHLGLAARNLAPLDASDGWWHEPLYAGPVEAVLRYSGQPVHLEMMRQMLIAPTTPAQLRVACRASVGQVRGFVQACLFLRLLHWSKAR
jgi:hypothetical protein